MIKEETDMLEINQILGFFTINPRHRKILVLELGVECKALF